MDSALPTRSPGGRFQLLSLVTLSGALAALGLLGIERGDEVSQAGQFHGKQMVWLALAGGAMSVACRVPLRWLRSWAGTLFVVSLVLLTLVYLFPARWGSRRWIPLGLLYFQPSELAKISFILALARHLIVRENYRRPLGLVVPFVVTIVPLVLILREPDLGTSLLFLPVLYAMLFAAGARVRHLALVAVLGVAVLPLFWQAMSAEQRSRITAVFQQRDGTAPAVGKADGFHLHQSKQVLSLGGAWGSQFQGTLVDDPAAYYLPACRTDFVLCMVGERFGLAGTLTVLVLYSLLFAQGLAIAGATRDPFGRLVAVGIVALLAAQTVINAGMTVGLLPVTGITLPLMSYGGSSLLFTGAAIGLLVNVSRLPDEVLRREPFRFGQSARQDRRLSPVTSQAGVRF
ncbi:MAG: rod shape-determining protein RodA [Planctomycetaceae bacterium]|nr:MAG: rod shape-determining protein RodA [Planctomycetaceae bacterium]